MRKEQHFWNGIALFGFAVLGVIAIVIISRYGTDPNALGFFDLLVMGLGTFRLIHLLTYDKIFEIVRVRFMDRKGEPLKTAERGWRRLVCEFLQCIWCTGVWSALIIVTAYLLGTWGRVTVILLAVAGLGSLLQILSTALASRN